MPAVKVAARAVNDDGQRRCPGAALRARRPRARPDPTRRRPALHRSGAVGGGGWPSGELAAPPSRPCPGTARVEGPRPGHLALVGMDG